MPKPYPREFRADVVTVARRGEAQLKQIAKDFGIAESCLANWLKAADVEGGQRASVTAEEPEQLRELKRRNRLLEQDATPADSRHHCPRSVSRRFTPGGATLHGAAPDSGRESTVESRDRQGHRSVPLPRRHGFPSTVPRAGLSGVVMLAGRTERALTLHRRIDPSNTYLAWFRSPDHADTCLTCLTNKRPRPARRPESPGGDYFASTMVR